MCKILSVCITLLIIGSADALKIEINKGDVRPDPIAIVDFFDKNGNDSEKGHAIGEIITRDLELSGLFVPIDSSSFLESSNVLATRGHNIKNWNVLNARFLVYGIINNSGSNFSVDFKLIDVVTGGTMLSMSISGTEAKLRKTAHVIADYIYERVTNEQGYFNTHIIVVESASRAGIRRKTRLVKIDQDGYNPENLTDGSELVLMARYSPDAQNIAYISYSDTDKGILGKSAHVYVMNLQTGSQRLLINKSMMRELIKKNHGNPVQMTYAPRFSSDGKKAVLAIIIDGKSAIYILDIDKNELKQLTKHECIDTSPCFSPDGSRIVFTSNRDGREAIFTMNSDGSDQKKISKEGGKYSQPMWSPRGDLIAFAKTFHGQFYIGVMKPDGSGERLITSGYLVEAPCWASNGRYIAYSCESGPKQKAKVGVVDITGNHTRLIETRGDAMYPAWSPKLAVKIK
ncbi:MAG: Tol-Pal system protein TolB [Holosporales bacterium]|jgi:TolB protein|nr:Tol-Pal system protein TolB [Holosporales bacterium]